MRKFLTFLLFWVCTISFSQEDAWVYFNDKPNAQTFLNNPLSILSQRALDRRTTQNIPLDNQDVPIHQPYIDQITAVPGITVLAKSKWLNTLHIRGTQEAINGLMTLPFVSHVDFANKSLNARNTARAVSPLFDNDLVVQDNFQYGISAHQIQLLNGHSLHQQNFTGAGKIIAVLDAGFPGVDNTAPFAKIRNNNQIKGGYDFVNRSENFYTGSRHGTMVLSTMAAYFENELIGTAPDASYYLFRTSDTSIREPVEESFWVEAAEKADSLGVDVINVSLGFSTFNNANYSYTYQDMDGNTTFISRGANIAFSRGMIVVTSAGNKGNRPWRYITAPADVANVLAVGSVNFLGERSAFSSQGPTPDGRIKPDLMAMGSGTVIATETGEIDYKSGTSLASPTLAGLVACLWQALPNKTNTQIIQLIKESADHYGNPDNFYGYGIPNFQQALNTALSTESFSVNGFTLFPNPTEGTITITSPDHSEASLILYNSLGREVVRKNLNSVHNEIVSLEHLTPGIYFYAIISGEATFSGKLIRK